ncbi:hypothetical protein BSKO_06417 [Bryopsis sp. KO-2023]|nr:hypothetical protein BSKO_06417 [Bryopsis sp. KO-2023]
MDEKKSDVTDSSQNGKNTFAAVASALLQFSIGETDESVGADCTHQREVSSCNQPTLSKSVQKTKPPAEPNGQPNLDIMGHPECMFKVRGAATYARSLAVEKPKEAPTPPTTKSMPAKSLPTKSTGGWIEQVQEALKNEGKTYGGVIWKGGHRSKMRGRNALASSRFWGATSHSGGKEGGGGAGGRGSATKHSAEDSIWGKSWQMKAEKPAERLASGRNGEGVCTSDSCSDSDSVSGCSLNSAPSSPGSKECESLEDGVSHCTRKRSARAGAGAKLAKLVTQEAKSLKAMEREASELRKRAARSQRRKEKRLRKEQLSRVDMPRAGLSEQQQQEVHRTLMSGSLLGLWKRRGRPPNRLKNMILQQALNEAGIEMASPQEPTASDPNDEESVEEEELPLKRKRSRPAKSTMMVEMPATTSESESESGSDPYDGLEVDELYGCPKCDYRWSGCEVCQTGEPLAVRPKSRWEPDKAHHQNVPSAPTYRPTAEEFKNPLEYINKIRPEAEKYGICSIIPPEGWDPPFDHCMKLEEFKFCTKKQMTSSLCQRLLRNKTHSSNTPEVSSTAHSSRMSRMSPKLTEADDFGFHVIDEPISMRAFQSYAEWSTAGHFAEGDPSKMPELSVTQIEGEFWRIVESATTAVEVLYGSDLDSGELGSGFPPPNRKPSGCAGEGEERSRWPPEVEKKIQEYAAHPWNINSWPRRYDSVLRHVEGDELITGVMVPWLYMGSCLSAFCWHVEDHFLYSVNYLHKGAKKVWYGVPGRACKDFEMAMKDALPHLFEADPNLLHRLVTHLSPRELQNRGVPVHRVEHSEGSFVITFPNAYHGGFNCGWNCAEAVNFAPADWLPHGTDATARYKLQARATTFSHDALLVSLVKGVGERQREAGEKVPVLGASDAGQKKDGANKGTSSDSAKDVVAMYALGELVLRIEEEHRRRTVAGRCGIDKELRMHGAQGSKDENGVHTNTEDVDCMFCKSDLYLSAVVSQESPGKAMCPEHASHIPGSRVLLYRYTIAEMQSMTNRAVEVLPESRAYIEAAQTRFKAKRRPSVVLKGPFAAPHYSKKPSQNAVLGKRNDFIPSEDMAPKRPKLDAPKFQASTPQRSALPQHTGPIAQPTNPGQQPALVSMPPPPQPGLPHMRLSDFALPGLHTLQHRHISQIRAPSSLMPAANPGAFPMPANPAVSYEDRSQHALMSGSMLVPVNPPHGMVPVQPRPTQSSLASMAPQQSIPGSNLSGATVGPSPLQALPVQYIVRPPVHPPKASHQGSQPTFPAVQMVQPLQPLQQAKPWAAPVVIDHSQLQHRVGYTFPQGVIQPGGSLYAVPTGHLGQVVGQPMMFGNGRFIAHSISGLQTEATVPALSGVTANAIPAPVDVKGVEKVPTIPKDEKTDTGAEKGELAGGDRQGVGRSGPVVLDSEMDRGVAGGGVNQLNASINYGSSQQPREASETKKAVDEKPSGCESQCNEQPELLASSGLGLSDVGRDDVLPLPIR